MVSYDGLQVENVCPPVGWTDLTDVVEGKQRHPGKAEKAER
jgi:hypothetical protein